MPLADAANNQSPLSQLNQVEEAVADMLREDKTVGYKVVAIYSQQPFGNPRLAVSTLVGLLPGSWLNELRDLLYYETHIPTGLLCTWWDMASWNPIPYTRWIRDWMPADSVLSFTFHASGKEVRKLTHGPNSASCAWRRSQRGP